MASDDFGLSFIDSQQHVPYTHVYVSGPDGVPAIGISSCLLSVQAEAETHLLLIRTNQRNSRPRARLVIFRRAAFIARDTDFF